MNTIRLTEQEFNSLIEERNARAELIQQMDTIYNLALEKAEEREKEFAPVKNKTGVDSIDTARELLKKNGIEI